MLADEASASVSEYLSTCGRNVGDYSEGLLNVGLDDASIFGVEAAVDGLLPNSLDAVQLLELFYDFGCDRSAFDDRGQYV